MSRIAPLLPENATGHTEQVFAAIKRALGVVPNLYRTVGHQAKTLETVLNFGAGQPTLTAKEKEVIALAVAEANGCHYCLAAHSFLAKAAGLSADESQAARRGASCDPKRAALLGLVTGIVAGRGAVDDATYAAFLAAGYTEAQVPEVVLAVTQNLFTNYFNNLNGTAVDFPAAPAL